MPIKIRGDKKSAQTRLVMRSITSSYLWIKPGTLVPLGIALIHIAWMDFRSLQPPVKNDMWQMIYIKSKLILKQYIQWTDL